MNIYIAKPICIALKIKIYTAKINSLSLSTCIYVGDLGFSVIGARGGIQAKPLSPNSASLYVTDSRLTSLIINTPFSVIYAFGHRQLQEPKYFEEEELKRKFSPFHENANFYQWPDSIQKPDQPENVCVIVLESFPKNILDILMVETDTLHFLIVY